MRIVWTMFAAAVMACGGALADPIFTVTVNTSSVNGQNGYLDFQFNPGFPQPPAGTATISDFVSSGGTLGVEQLFGNVSGTLQTTVVMVNDPTTLTNEFLTPFTFGTSLRFVITFSGAMIATPDPTSGTSTFAFAMFDANDPANPLLVTSPLPPDNPGGFALLLDVQNDGTVAASNFMTSGALTPGAPGAVPEPGTLVLVGAGLAIAAVRRRRV